MNNYDQTPEPERTRAALASQITPQPGATLAALTAAGERVERAREAHTAGTWQIATGQSGRGSGPSGEILEIVRPNPGGGVHVVVGKFAGIDCLSAANAARIVACVNFCAGVPTEDLPAGGLAELREQLARARELGDGALDAGFKALRAGNDGMDRCEARIAQLEGELAALKGGK